MTNATLDNPDRDRPVEGPATSPASSSPRASSASARRAVSAESKAFDAIHRLRGIEPASSSLEELLECYDSAAHKIVQMMERFNDRLTLDNLRLVERYAKGEVAIRINFMTEIAGEYIAHFERALDHRGSEERAHLREPLKGQSRARLERVPVRKIGHRPVHLPEPDSTKVYAGARTANRKNKAMLVDIVEAIEHPELMPITSLVRFERPERCKRVGADSRLYFSAKEGFISIHAPKNGEVELFVSDECSKMHKEKLVGEVIERAPQVLSGVSDDACNVCVDFSDLADLPLRLLCLRIYLANDAIGFGCEEGSDLPFKIKDVCFGPFDFDVDKREALISRQCHK